VDTPPPALPRQSGENVSIASLAAGLSGLPGNPATPPQVNTRQSSSIASSISAGDTRDQGTSASSDSVSISTPAAVLGRLSGQRAQKLEGITAAVRSGSYAPSSSAIAGAIVAQAIS